VQLRLQTAPSAGADSDLGATPPPPLCASRAGFSLHAAVTVAADDKQGRLRLLRYGARPALSSQHLSRLPDGRVRYLLRRNPGPASPQAITLEPTELLRRLAATLPRPYQHRTVYHGICACSRPSGAPRWRRKFAPAATRRFEVSPAATRDRRRSPCCPPRTGVVPDDARTYRLQPSHRDAPEPPVVARFGTPPPPARPPSGRFPWAELIARTFPGALDCPRCGATLSVIAYITQVAVVRKILEHLGLSAAPTELAPARLPDELGSAFDVAPDEPSSTEADPSGQNEPAATGRGPPGCAPNL
jgi:hypothetical protein